MAISAMVAKYEEQNVICSDAVVAGPGEQALPRLMDPDALTAELPASVRPRFLKVRVRLVREVHIISN